MGRILIRAGRVIDPVSGRDGRADLLIEEGRIAAIEASIEAPGAERVDASGCWVIPGLIDLHAHLREPGEEYKEDFASGGRAAVAGGFTSVCCMANTHPVNDDPAVTDYMLDRARQDSPARVFPIAAATRGLAGKVMTEMAALQKAGAVAFSDDGKTIMDASVMRRVLEYARVLGAPISTHAEDCHLVAGGVVNEGPVSTRLGLPGNPCLAETVLVARDLQLAAATGGHLHVGHVSTAGAVAMIREAKERGVRVTAEVTPHHLVLTDERALGYDTDVKMAPPLRSAADVRACREGLVEGVLDCIATDHAPHAPHEKDVEFTAAPPGVLGFETALPVVLDLVRTGEITPIELVRRMTANPARIFQRAPLGQLTVGGIADVVVLDPERRWIYDPAKGFSKSRNSPWAGEEMIGRVIVTLVDGRVVYDVERGVLFP